MTIDGQIILDEATIADFCRQNGIARMAVFGSRARDESREDSDLDLLVEFLPDRKVSLFDVGGMMAELSQRLGLQVDMRTARDMSPLVRDQVLREARTIYAAA